MSAPTASTSALPNNVGETVEVTSRVVTCDGGVGPLGHPRVFLRIPGTEVVCPYCSRRYVLKPGADAGDTH